MKNTRPSVAIVIAVLGIIVLTLAAFFVFRTQSPQNPMTQIPISTSTAEVSSSTAATSTTTPALSQSTPVTQETAQGIRLYENAAFHFSLTYPDTLQATEYQEAGGALTVSFQDPSTNDSFEVYTTPYSGTQITEARFKLDEPSGTFLQPTNVVISGVNATMFYGYNPLMGDTREVWFIHGGILYEVATYKQLDTWLA
jgi:hypothetical protein